MGPSMSISYYLFLLLLLDEIHHSRNPNISTISSKLRVPQHSFKITWTRDETPGMINQGAPIFTTHDAGQYLYRLSKTSDTKLQEGS